MSPHPRGASPASWCCCADILDKPHEPRITHQQAQAVGHSGDVDHTTVVAILEQQREGGMQERGGGAAATAADTLLATRSSFSQHSTYCAASSVDCQSLRMLQEVGLAELRGASPY